MLVISFSHFPRPRLANCLYGWGLVFELFNFTRLEQHLPTKRMVLVYLMHSQSSVPIVALSRLVVVPISLEDCQITVASSSMHAGE